MGEGEGKREKGPSKASLNPQDQFLPTSPTQFLALPGSGIIYHIMNPSRINPRIPSQPQQSHYPASHPGPHLFLFLFFWRSLTFTLLSRHAARLASPRSFLFLCLLHVSINTFILLLNLSGLLDISLLLSAARQVNPAFSFFNCQRKQIWFRPLDGITLGSHLEFFWRTPDSAK